MRAESGSCGETVLPAAQRRERFDAVAWRAPQARRHRGLQRRRARGQPGLRQRLQGDLRKRGLPRKKVVAAIVSLLDTTRVRIGNLSYARDNHSFGLTTLRKRHLAFINERRVLLRFKGKSGIEHEVNIDDRRIVKVILDCQKLRGRNLFQYLDDDGKRRAIGAEQVNSYLRETMNAEFTAKDFRTWGATVRAFELMLDTPLPELPTKRALKAGVVSATKKVAEELRNTPAVCRKSYINPLVFSAWQEGILHGCVQEQSEGTRETLECMVLAFLRKEEATRANAEPRWHDR